MAVARKAVFNTRRHRVLRNWVPVGENIISLLVLGTLVLIVLWAIGLRESYDPDVRELAPELLASAKPEIAIYTPPLKSWAEPGTLSAPTLELGPYPTAILDDAWTLAGRIRRFETGNLYEKINGEAEKFFAHGFQSMHYAVLRAPDGAELAIELYDQGDVGGSTGIFAAHGAAERDVHERSGVVFFNTSIGVIGRKGRFFFRAAGDRESEDVSAKAQQLVAAFAALESAATDTMPEGLRLLTQAMGVAESDAALIAENAFQLDFAKDFWFGRLPDTEDAEIFVHIADSEQSASALLSDLIEEQRYDYQAVTAATPWTTLRHSVLGTYFAVGRRGPIVFGVHRFQDADGIGALMERFEAGLQDE